uniref:Uncharacterized protein n=1 Tax=Plectus sambesii TaxID=2011161 RepID=A0A914VST5_9BILA
MRPLSDNDTRDGRSACSSEDGGDRVVVAASGRSYQAGRSHEERRYTGTAQSAAAAVSPGRGTHPNRYCLFVPPCRRRRAAGGPLVLLRANNADEHISRPTAVIIRRPTNRSESGRRHATRRDGARRDAPGIADGGQEEATADTDQPADWLDYSGGKCLHTEKIALRCARGRRRQLQRDQKAGAIPHATAFVFGLDGPLQRFVCLPARRAHPLR